MKKAIALALLAASAAAMPAAAQPAPSPTAVPMGPNSALLSLTAEGRSTRTPDLALFTAGVVTQGRTAAEALSENSRQMAAVVAALRRAGVAERDIQTSSLNLIPRYTNPERDAMIRARETREPYVPPAEPSAPRIVGYDARNHVQVRVRRVAEMGRIIDALASAGANEIHGPNFTMDEPRAALDEARAAAVAEARQRAELYARAAGMRVVRIVSITEAGGYYPAQGIMVTGMRTFDVGSPPPPPAPVSPGELSLGVNVSVQFELAR
ncbi:MAG TPA: SIMPL domain-containing protein [Allosphingosinicella sp.]|nr:SIMPL domain-containing protein [Allosphingosinicella sp.]